MTGNFNYHNKEVKQMGGLKLVRKVSIKNGKGYKSVTKFRKGKKVGTIKKTISDAHIGLIQMGQFVTGLFSDCKCGMHAKTKKNKM